MRECTRCHQVKGLSEFRFQPTVQRYHRWCRDCERAYSRSRSSRPRSASRIGRTAPAAAAPIERAFGVELEFQGSSTALLAAMREQGLRCEEQRYNHSDSATTWKIVPDGSVLYGAELVSPILRGADGFDQVRKATAALVAAGCRPNRSTGMHVHHDARGETVETIARVAEMYMNLQGQIDMIVAPSRRGTSWAKRITPEFVRRVRVSGLAGLRSFDRYHAVNVAAYARHSTIEFRQHQGTVNGTKVAAWVRLGQAMFTAAKAGTEVRTLDDLPLSERDKDFFAGRTAVFQRRAGVR